MCSSGDGWTDGGGRDRQKGGGGLTEQGRTCPLALSADLLTSLPSSPPLTLFSAEVQGDVMTGWHQATVFLLEFTISDNDGL